MVLETTGVSSIFCGHTGAAAKPVRMAIVLMRFIISTRGIRRIERRGRGGCSSLKNGVDGWQDGKRCEAGKEQAADHRAGERRRLRTALAKSDGHGNHAEDHRRGGHQNGAQAAARSFLNSFENGLSVTPVTFGKRD